MNKSIYSLVLSDEVIEAIDRMAYSMNTSRSNLINQILAESVSYVTPEKRVHDVFSRMEQLLTEGDAFQLMMQPSDSMFSLRTALSYKYNPTIKYSVELFKDIDERIGRLRIILRSRNTNLLLYMVAFFNLWSALEMKYNKKSDCTVENGKFTKTIFRKSNALITESKLGEEISDYINLIDTSVKKFFANLEYPQETAIEIEAMYRNYLQTHEIAV